MTSQDGASLGARAPITSYGDGGFGFAGGLRRMGSILILADGVYAWDASELASLTPGGFEPFFASLTKGAPRPDFFLLGVGVEHLFPPMEIRRLFLSQRVGLEVMNTGAACRTCNVLLAETRSFAAGLIAV
jgi:uncharacterized protein